MKACATESFQWTQRVQKGSLFWSPNGTLKKGSFYPILVGSEKGSKVEVFDGLGICNDADAVIWLIRSEGLCNRISKEEPKKRSRFGHFQGLALRVQNGVQNRVPKAQKDRIQ